MILSAIRSRTLLLYEHLRLLKRLEVGSMVMGPIGATLQARMQRPE